VANQIGPLTARIIANSEGMDPGLKAGVQKVEAAGKQIAEAGERAGLGFAKSFAQGVAGFSAAGLAATTAAVVALYKEGASNVKELAAGAKEANVGLADFQAVATAIGDINVASNALGEMREKLFEVQTAGGAASGVLASVIPDAFAIEAMGTAKAFGFISDRIRELGSRSAQLTAAKGVFKKAGEPALEAILRGSGYVDMIRGRLADYGADVTDSTYQSIKAAERATRDLGMMRKGFSNQVTVALAPGLAELASRLPTLASIGVTAKGLAGLIVDGADKLLTAAGRLADTFADWIDDPWGMLKQTWEDLWGWAAGMWDKMLSQLKAIFDAAIDAMTKGIQHAIEEGLRFWKRLTDGTPVPAGAGKFPRFGGGGGGAAEDLSDAFGTGAGTGGDWGGEETDPGGWRKRGKWEEFANSFVAGWRQRMADLRRSAEENNPFDIWSRAAETFAEKLDGPFEKFKGEWLKLQGILRVPGEGFPADAAGIQAILLNRQIQGRGGYQLLQQLRSLGGEKPGTQFLGAAERGSREDYSAFVQYQGAALESLEEEIKRLLTEANETQKRQEADGRRAVEILRDLNGKLEVGGF
jgi:hypothetical protein